MLLYDKDVFVVVVVFLNVKIIAYMYGADVKALFFFNVKIIAVMCGAVLPACNYVSVTRRSCITVSV